MMKRSFSWIVALGALTMVFFTSCGNTVHIEKDSSANLNSYRTYGWEEKQLPKNTKASRLQEITDQNIRNAVDAQMQKKGYTISTTDPDLLLSTDVLVHRDRVRQSDPVYSQSFTRSYFNPYTRRINTFYYPSQFQGYDTYTTTVRNGTVTVTMIDTKTDKAVWQGWSTKSLSSNNITQDDINSNVRSIFKKFKK